MLLRAVGQETAQAKTTTARKTGRGTRPPATRVTPAAAKPTKASRSAVAAKKAARGGNAQARAYRRMPDDLPTVYKRTGGASAVAEHYGVPRHTVQGWLRTQGAL